MIEFAIFTVGAVLGFLIGWKLREAHALRHMAALQSKFQPAPTNKVDIWIDCIDGVFYVYNATTKEFLVQGNSHQEVSALLSKRFPNIVFLAHPQNLEQAGYKL